MHESEPAVDFGFGGTPGVFSSGNDLMRKNAEKMRKISDTFYDKMSGFGPFGALNDPFANAVDKTNQVNHWYFDNAPKRSTAPPPVEPEQRARTVEHTTLSAFTEPKVRLKLSPTLYLT